MPAKEDNATLVAIEQKLQQHRTVIDKSQDFLSRHADQKDVDYVGQAFRLHEEASAMLDKLAGQVVEARQKLGPADLYAEGVEGDVDQIDVEGDPMEAVKAAAAHEVAEFVQTEGFQKIEQSKKDAEIARQLAKEVTTEDGEEGDLLDKIAEDQQAAELETAGKDGEDEVIIEENQSHEQEDKYAAMAAAVGEIADYQETKGQQERERRDAIIASQHQEEENLKGQTPDGYDDGQQIVAQDGDENDDDVIDDELNESEFKDGIRREAIMYVRGRNLDEADYDAEIDGAVDELYADLQQQGNNNAQQMQAKLQGILGDVPKVMQIRLPQDDGAAKPANKIPDEVMAELNQAFDKVLGEDYPDRDGAMAEIIHSIRRMAQDEYQFWPNHIAGAVKLFKKQQDEAAAGPEEEVELPDNGFELTVTYWEKNKGKHADSKGTLSAAIGAYEGCLANVEYSQGLDKLRYLAQLDGKLTAIQTTADKVYKGLGKMVHKASRKLLEGVPYAVKQGRSDTQKLIAAHLDYLRKKTYENIGDADIVELWTEMLKDPEKKANKDQQEYVDRYDNGEHQDNHAAELHKFVVKNLNLPARKYQFELNDTEAWDEVYSIVRGQLQSEFTGGGFRDWARDRIKEYAG